MQPTISSKEVPAVLYTSKILLPYSYIHESLVKPLQKAPHTLQSLHKPHTIFYTNYNIPWSSEQISPYDDCYMCE